MGDSERRGSLMPSVSKKGAPNMSRFGRSRLMSITGSRKTLTSTTTMGADARLRPPVFDENGIDVTPQPLVPFNAIALTKAARGGLGGSGSGTPTDLTSSVLMSSVIGDVIGKSVLGSEMGTTEQRSVMAQDSFVGEFAAEPGAVEHVVGLADVVTKREEVMETFTEKDLSKVVDVTLTETQTIWLLDLIGTCLPEDLDEAEKVKEQNAKYKSLCAAHVGNDLYVERGMQTLNGGRKVKQCQTINVPNVEKICMATNWDLYDSFKALEPPRETEDDEDDEGFISRPDTPKAGSTTSQEIRSGMGSVAASAAASGRETPASETESGSLFVGSEQLGVVASVSEISTAADEALLQTPNFKESLFIMERIINQNIYHDKLAAFRDLPILPDIDAFPPEEEDENDFDFEKPKPIVREVSTPVVQETSKRPMLDRLWTFSCPRTKGYVVTCLSWNKRNPDLFAVGYGQSNYNDQKDGLACCWSIKNIEFPERIYQTETSVVSLDFSEAYPNLLAVGTYNGSILIYDVKTSLPQSILDSFESEGKHAGPVWQVLWVDRSTADERGDSLVSIASDGRITQWSIRKGFEHSDLMKLKKMIKSHGPKSKKTDSFINRYSSGMGLDFKLGDNNMYLAGTEDGHIHRCSCSYNEQFLDSYSGHMGPVYKVLWSPFVPEVFISASADWTLKLWNQDNPKPILSLQPATTPIADICWSPFSSTVFGSVTERAVEIFDLSVNPLDPVITQIPSGTLKLSAIAFAKNSNCILVGDSDGQVTVYKMFNLKKEADLAENENLASIVSESLERQTQTEEQRKKSEKEKSMNNVK